METLETFQTAEDVIFFCGALQLDFFEMLVAEGEEQREPWPTGMGCNPGIPCFLGFNLGQEKSGPEGSFDDSAYSKGPL